MFLCLCVLCFSFPDQRLQVDREHEGGKTDRQGGGCERERGCCPCLGLQFPSFLTKRESWTPWKAAGEWDQTAATLAGVGLMEGNSEGEPPLPGTVQLQSSVNDGRGSIRMVLGCQDEGCSSSPLLTEETSPFCFSPSLSVQWPWRRGAQESHRVPTQLVWLSRHLWAGTRLCRALEAGILTGTPFLP